MSTRRSLKKKLGQAAIEYTMLITIIAAASIAMQLYVQRAVRANLKILEEQINAKPVISEGTQK